MSMRADASAAFSTADGVVAINPCKMCEPIGAIFALKGVEGAVVLLHGSQGCATYMRRHMAGHFNEPIDVASSSLSETGAVYGGEANLKQGMANVIKSYHPALVGVVTTCLSETIGDDVERIVKEFAQDEAASQGSRIVPVSTPSYMGTQTEGFNAALLSLATHLAEPTGRPNGKLNVLPGNVSPADVRYIKDLLERMGVAYTMLPDISETLDAPSREFFQPIPEGGTPLVEIAGMADAMATVQCGSSAVSASAAAYLEEAHGVPGEVLPLPIGLANSDRFLEALSSASGRPIPERYVKERGRLLDCMIDAHKALFGARPVIYGDADLVEGLTALACEVGMEPAVVATGGGDEGFVERVRQLVGERAAAPAVLTQVDFIEIHRLVQEKGADLLIGNSDGMFVAEKEKIPLVRTGFPIHDRLGGQRQLLVGYEGAMNLIELAANALLDIEQNAYRAEALALIRRKENER